MKIVWRNWVNALGENEAGVDRLKTLLRTGDSAWNIATATVEPVYKAWTEELTVDALDEIHRMIVAATPSAMLMPKSDLDKMAEEIGNRRSPEWLAEQQRKREQRREEQQRAEQAIVSGGLERLGGHGTTWTERKAEIERWWESLKAGEAKETWRTAYRDNRISARQIAAEGRGGTFSIANMHQPLDNALRREIVLNRSLDGIHLRMNPDNFRDPRTGVNHKDAKGLHDLSASLLDSRKQTIKEQLKGYDDAVMVLMPVPSETDLMIFHAICSLKDPDEDTLRGYRNRFTRIRFAQSSDMGATYRDAAAKPSDPAQVRYGLNGRVELGKGAIRIADDVDIAARRSNAIMHSRALEGGAVPVNEIVMVYRRHESPLFPLVVKWNNGAKRFDVVDRETGKKPTGAYIDNAGTWHDG